VDSGVAQQHGDGDPTVAGQRVEQVRDPGPGDDRVGPDAIQHRRDAQLAAADLLA
jgi:hypothetical protein